MLHIKRCNDGNLQKIAIWCPLYGNSIRNRVSWSLQKALIRKSVPTRDILPPPLLLHTGRGGEGIVRCVDLIVGTFTIFLPVFDSSLHKRQKASFSHLWAFSRALGQTPSIQTRRDRHYRLEKHEHDRNYILSLDALAWQAYSSWEPKQNRVCRWQWGCGSRRVIANFRVGKPFGPGPL